MLAARLRDDLPVVALGQLLCSSDGASRKTAWWEEMKKDGYESGACCRPCKSDRCIRCPAHTHNGNTHTCAQHFILTVRSTHILHGCAWVPAMCVTVAVHVALTSAARSRTFQHILMHGQNCREDTNTHVHTITQTVGRSSRETDTTPFI